MRNATWLALALAMAVLLAAPALLAEEAKAPAKDTGEGKEKSASGLKGEYAIMASELKLTAEQQAALAAKLAAREEAFAAWKKDNGAKLEAAQEALIKARKSADKEGIKKAAGEIKTIDEGRQKIAAEAAAAIRAIFTPKQLQAWEGFSLYRQVLALYRKADLTEAQHKKVRELCDAAGKEFAAGKDKDEVRAKLEEDVEGLLTAAQKEAVKRAEKAGADKAPAKKAAKAAEK